ncbi:acyl carrier protein [Clostridium formicaceticum]|uniref:Phosphopantetheine attachment site n=1 Tax=Clostridium formicaceticum TaxID=1497 RepID=A0AAC9WFL8_9CLOT|nr:acyl carrier protein [Clostridium formicaceticum]AOY75651.1 hypothetical protein BJL90_06935 [Clostridium formicaceticum]ARE85965.1 Phosphopantetheine attachment site [Clostridium formicaceticum]
MKVEELIEKIAEALLEEREITLETELDELEGWDSLGRLGIIALFDELFNQSLEAEKLKRCETIEDIVSLVKVNLEE